MLLEQLLDEVLEIRPFETADVASIEMLKARYEPLKAQLAAAEGRRMLSTPRRCRRTAGDGRQGTVEFSNCRPTHGAHGRALKLWWRRLAG